MFGSVMKKETLNVEWQKSSVGHKKNATSPQKSPRQHFFKPEKWQHTTRGGHFLYDRGRSKDEKVSD